MDEGFNPRSPCGERLGRVIASGGQLLVSTHAPLAGSDELVFVGADRKVSFNPRSPCGERLSRHRTRAGAVFVSTHAPLAGSD